MDNLEKIIGLIDRFNLNSLEFRKEKQVSGPDEIAIRIRQGKNICEARVPHWWKGTTFDAWLEQSLARMISQFVWEYLEPEIPKDD